MGLQFLYMTKIDNFFHKTHFIPVHLQKMSNSSNLCYKCHRGAFIYLICTCGHIQAFWKEAHSVIQEDTSKCFTLSSSLYLLNQALQVPVVCMWISQISAPLPLEKLTYDLNHKLDKL